MLSLLVFIISPTGKALSQCLPAVLLFEFSSENLFPISACHTVQLDLRLVTETYPECPSDPVVDTVHLYFKKRNPSGNLNFTLLDDNFPNPLVYVGDTIIGALGTYNHYRTVDTLSPDAVYDFWVTMSTDIENDFIDPQVMCEIEVTTGGTPETTGRFQPSNVVDATVVDFIVGSPGAPSGTETLLSAIAKGFANGGMLTPPQSESQRQNVVVHNTLVIDTSYSIVLGSIFALAEGASIKVSTGVSLNIAQLPTVSTAMPLITTCDEAMWDRIELEADATLTINGAVVEQGDEAVVITGGGATLNISNTNMLNNRIHVHKEYGTGNADAINISGTSMVTNSADMLSPNTGNTNTQGVFINNQTTPVMLQGNTYQNLLLGVNAQNTNVVSTAETYIDLTGAGIYMGSDALHTLTQSNGTFDNTRVAIEGRNINLISSGNQMDNISHGYRLYNGKSRSFDIHDNTINASNFGVLMFNWNAFGTAAIADNEINIASPTAPDAAGIRMAGMPHVTGEVVSGNTITINGAKKGIDFQDCVRIFAIDNEIIKQDAGQFWDGIGVQGGVFVFPYCNNIRGGNIGGTQRGISISQATNVRPSCNTIDSTLMGIRYDGANLRADVRANSFNSHNNGLEVGATGILGPQLFRGNRWVDSLLIADGLVHFGGEDLATLSKFTVNTNEGSSFGTSADPANFIDDNPNQSNLNCSGGQFGCTSPPNPTELDDFGETDCAIAIALDTMAASSYPAAERWTAKRQLYRSLMEVADSITYLDECLEDFYNTEDTTTVGQFEQLRKDMLALFQPSGGNLQTFNQNYTEWNGLGGQLNAVLAELRDTNTNSQDSLLLMTQRDSLLQEMADVSHVQDSLDQLFQTAWIAGATALLSVNTAITATYIWEHNQRNFNRVWLQMVANDQAAPDSNQMDALLYTAYQCPYAGGEAVYQARALLGEGYAYNDSTLCAPVLPLIKKHVETTPSFTAYPNPGQHYVVVELEEVAQHRGTVTLTDLLGRTIRSQTINDGDQQVYLLLDAVPAGMYHLTVSIDSKASSRLFSIVK